MARPLSGEPLMRGLLDSLPDVAVLALDVSGRITGHDCAAELVFGCSAEFLDGEHVARFYPATTAGAEQAESALTLAAGTGRHYAASRLRRGAGSHFEGEVTTTPLTDDAGTLRGFGHVTRDVTEGRELERLLSHQALHDALTGLPNRTLFLDRTRHALLRSSALGQGSLRVHYQVVADVQTGEAVALEALARRRTPPAACSRQRTFGEYGLDKPSPAR